MTKDTLETLKQYIEEFKTIKKEQVNDNNNFITSKKYAITLNNGNTIIREQLLKANGNGSAALVLPVLEDGNILLTVEPRVFTKKTVGVGIVAGYIEENELPKTAALRELLEETGYVPKELIRLGGFYQDMGCSAAYNESFLGIDCKKVKEQNPDSDEYIKYLSCGYDDAMELIDLGYIEGSNAIITLERAKQYIKGR